MNEGNEKARYGWFAFWIALTICNGALLLESVNASRYDRAILNLACLIFSVFHVEQHRRVIWRKETEVDG